MIERNIISIAEYIQAWEIEHGESFADYFLDDSVTYKVWAVWLIAKGFSDIGNAFLKSIIDDTADQDIFFPYEDDYDSHGQNIELWAQFIFEIDVLWKFFTDFTERVENQV